MSACGGGAPLTSGDAGGEVGGADVTATAATSGSAGPTSTGEDTPTGGSGTGGATEAVTGGPTMGGTQGLTTMETPTSTSTAGETDETGETGGTKGTGGTEETGGTGASSTGDSTTGAVEMCPCPDLEVGLDDGIFVLSKSAELWKYFPGDNKLEMLGAVDCGLKPSTFSMGVDRQGYAWVQFSDRQLRKVDITDVSKCSDPGFVPDQDGVKNFGMAFVSNSAVDPCDRLYGNSYNLIPKGDKVAEFFNIDPETLKLMQLGKSDYGRAEVTGTGDGRAFLFAGPDPSRLVEVDRTSGATLSTLALPGVKTGGGFAFAFFAGDFYFFTDAESDGTSEVTHLDFDDSDKNGKQDLKVVLEDAPIRIVGAGVSTCAPIFPQ